MPHALLDLPPFPDTGYAPLADRIGRLIGTTNDVLLIQGEAVVALEAAATSLARPGFGVLNIVTSPYGALFGGWLKRGGAAVENLAVPDGLPVDAETVAAALAAGRYAALALVHAESATGILNPLEEIAALARAHGALLIVDAVASIGGHTFNADALGVDVAVIGPQKALGGSAGVSAVSLSPRAWESVLAQGGPADSILSLADQKRLWLDRGRPVLPGTPSSLEFWALEAALERVEGEGLAAIEDRHLRATRSAHAGLLAIGVTPFAPVAKASRLVTTFRPEAIEPFLELPRALGLSRGVGVAGETLLRLNHTGPRADQAVVSAMIGAVAQTLGRAPEAAQTAVRAAWEA